MKICLFGGSFDPVHTGHLIIAQHAVETFELDRMVFIPAYRAPHKPGQHPAEPEQRIKMLELAVRGNAAFEVCTFEVEKKGLSYTHETVKHFRKLYPSAELFFLLGLDLLKHLHEWKDFEFLRRNVRFIVGRRKGYALHLTQAMRRRLGEDFAEELSRRIFSIPGMEISSTGVKSRIARGSSIKYIVPEKVEEYIYENGLYRDYR